MNLIYPSLWGTSGTVGSFVFAGGFEVDLAQNGLPNSSASSLEDVFIQPSSAVNGENEQSAKLLFENFVQNE